MNLFATLWPFGGRRSSSVGAVIDSPDPEPNVADDCADSEPGALGDAPDIDCDIIRSAGGPSWLQQIEPVPVPPAGKWIPSENHAEILLTALLEWGFGGRTLACAQLIRCHQVMCARLGLKVVHWNLVAAQFRKLIRQPKKYGWYREYGGERARLRIYNIPRRMPAKLRVVAGGVG